MLWPTDFSFSCCFSSSCIPAFRSFLPQFFVAECQGHQCHSLTWFVLLTLHQCSKGSRQRAEKKNAAILGGSQAKIDISNLPLLIRIRFLYHSRAVLLLSNLCISMSIESMYFCLTHIYLWGVFLFSEIKAKDWKKQIKPEPVIQQILMFRSTTICVLLKDSSSPLHVLICSTLSALMMLSH